MQQSLIPVSATTHAGHAKEVIAKYDLQSVDG